MTTRDSQRLRIGMHGSIGWSCPGGVFLRKDLTTARETVRGRATLHEYARCPLCTKEIRDSGWLRVMLVPDNER